MAAGRIALGVNLNELQPEVQPVTTDSCVGCSKWIGVRIGMEVDTPVDTYASIGWHWQFVLPLEARRYRGLSMPESIPREDYEAF